MGTTLPADRQTLPARILTLLPSPSGTVSTRAGTIMAASDRFIFTVEGRGGHGAMPHLAADPVLAGSAIVMALQVRGEGRAGRRPCCVDVRSSRTARLCGSVQLASPSEIKDFFKGPAERPPPPPAFAGTWFPGRPPLNLDPAAGLPPLPMQLTPPPPCLCRHLVSRSPQDPLNFGPCRWPPLPCLRRRWFPERPPQLTGPSSPCLGVALIAVRGGKSLWCGIERSQPETSQSTLIPAL